MLTYRYIRLVPAVLLSLSCCLPLPSHAASMFKEKAGAKDHPLVSRYQGSILDRSGVINFERVEFPVGPGKTEVVEGKVFNYHYVAPKDRSDLEVYRNFRQALEGSRFSILFACEEPDKCQKQGLSAHASRWTSEPRAFDGGYSPLSRMDDNGNYPPRFLVARLARAQGDVTVILTVKAPSSAEKDSGVGGPYFLQVIESGAMATGNVTVQADALGKGLAADGKVALYGIYFDTGKAEIKPESRAQLDEMAKLLSLNTNSRVLVVGHTDNQGGIEANLALSQKRADAVVAALVSTYKVDARRLQARGVANFSPLASNAAEAGRARNRRVELVEQ